MWETLDAELVTLSLGSETLTDVYIDMCINMRIDMCTDMCIDVCADPQWACAAHRWQSSHRDAFERMCTTHVSTRVSTHVYTHFYTHMCRHGEPVWIGTGPRRYNILVIII